jgi:hypothetical protein
VRAQAPLKGRSQGITMAKVPTRLARMGDDAAIALLKIFNECELNDPRTVKLFLFHHP